MLELCQPAMVTMWSMQLITIFFTQENIYKLFHQFIVSSFRVEIIPYQILLLNHSTNVGRTSFAKSCVILLEVKLNVTFCLEIFLEVLTGHRPSSGLVACIFVSS